MSVQDFGIENDEVNFDLIIDDLASDELGSLSDKTRNAARC